MTLRRGADGQWTVAAAVGERGMDHARDVNRSQRPADPDAAAAIVRAVAAAFDGSTAARMRDFGNGHIG